LRRLRILIDRDDRDQHDLRPRMHGPKMLQVDPTVALEAN
jgi:hypothetical protein